MLLQQSSYFCPTRIILGEGCLARLPEILAEHGARKVFIAVDAALLKLDFMRRILEEMERAGIACATFSEIEPDPTDLSVARAIGISAALEADLILAIGGGSTIDVAKAVAIVSTNGGRIHDYAGIERFSIPPLPLIAVPTTAGTGSEVSGSCVISDTQSGLKMSIRHAALNPARVAFLDPLVLASLPASVATHSGLDAFVHAFESYISRNANPFTDGINLHAIQLLARSLRPFVANRANSRAAFDMLCGSALAGMTFGQTGLGNVHCMARFIGARYHLSHGLSNALCLPVVARFNMISSPERYADIARAMGCHVEGLCTLEAAEVAIGAIRDLCADVGIPARLSDVGVAAEDIEELADLCIDAGYNRWNPRTTSRADFVQLFQQAL